eukprot:4351531-Amphidinium_carterae.1
MVGRLGFECTSAKETMTEDAVAGLRNLLAMQQASELLCGPYPSRGMHRCWLVALPHLSSVVGIHAQASEKVSSEQQPYGRHRTVEVSKPVFFTSKCLKLKCLNLEDTCRILFNSSHLSRDTTIPVASLIGFSKFSCTHGLLRRESVAL